jgi:hypothetical protein
LRRGRDPKIGVEPSTANTKQELHRHAAIEAAIGHMKTNGHLPTATSKGARATPSMSAVGYDETMDIALSRSIASVEFCS